MPQRRPRGVSPPAATLAGAAAQPLQARRWVWSRRWARTWERSERSSAAERVEDGHDRWPENDDEQGREDHEDEREEHLDRRLLRLLLDQSPAALTHLDREVAQDLPDRDAESLTLHHRAREGLDGRRRAAPDHVLERLHG